MSNCLYIAATEARSGKSAIVLGVMQLLLTHVRKVAIFRPIIHDDFGGGRDHDIDLILRHFKLPQEYKTTYAYTQSQATRMLNDGKHSLLMENILGKFRDLQQQYDFVLCEGSDYLGGEAAVEFEINMDVVSNLGCPVLAVLNGMNSEEDEICDLSQRTFELFKEKGLDVIAVMINRAEKKFSSDLVDRIKSGFSSDNKPLVYIIPDDKRLGNPTVKDVLTWLDCRVLYGADRLETPVNDYVVAAMQIENFLKYVSEGSLIITPGDRSDIILASLASRLSDVYPKIAGILLTGGIQPATTVHHLIEGWKGVPIPILIVPDHTYRTAQILQGLHGTIDPENKVKVLSALGLFETCVDSHELQHKLVSTTSSRITPFMFEHTLLHKAREKKQHIVLPEGTSERILRAADILKRRDVVDLTLLGNEDEVRQIASNLDISLKGINVIDPVKSEYFEKFVDDYYELRKHKCIMKEDARDRMSDPTYFGTMMVWKGIAGGMVSGSITTTAQTIKPAFEFVKTKPGVSIVSSVFLMCQNDQVMVYGDCAVNPNPNAQELAEIAISSAETAKIFSVEPRVAMLSYSTGVSGKGKDVDKVMEATEIVRAKAPWLAVEGPLQYDAAIDPDVAAELMPNSAVAGKATVLIFPDLNTGNNTYKAVQRSVPDSVAIGPILQGLKKPVNDLSRGCQVRDIVNTVAITAIQAQAEEEAGQSVKVSV
ncbi:phosphate acetyltransferase [Maridesulfovibrio ferrireducens]|uniref:phosphate acetyltransferase n=1 Tax=Maridesulfovibrio ferrireducens TaxID=246191 RepID=UPI001A1AA491|nr:phosphate acetyltransferase [Maridesulfovibrio ferrireducens]MBI9109776.1 phosphate acetyltransferase [Maridesulfovibrio ferrireducens]